MSLIKNLITEKDPPQKDEKKKEDEQKPRPIIKSATDLQRLKLEKLMKNPEKPIMIPEPRKEKDYMQSVPSFVRNVMGSSAGAGSGEFHVYRHLRRKEYARQKTIQAKSAREQMDEDYQRKIEDNQRAAEDKTAKKRAKRLKKKQHASKRTKSNQSKGQKEAQEKVSESDISEDEGDNESYGDVQTAEEKDMNSQEKVAITGEPAVNVNDEILKTQQEAKESEKSRNKEILEDTQSMEDEENKIGTTGNTDDNENHQTQSEWDEIVGGPQKPTENVSDHENAEKAA